jgi:hypothetical protein
MAANFIDHAYEGGLAVTRAKQDVAFVVGNLVKILLSRWRPTD